MDSKLNITVKEKMLLLERSIHLAVGAHKGQFDKAGVPYILHPLRVMSSSGSVFEKIVAVLHDTLEDTTLTRKQLRDEGFPTVVLDALDAVTKNKSENYDEFILRCKNNPVARSVKLLDMRDNCDLFRLQEIEEKHIDMVRKYHRGMKILRDDGFTYITS